MAGPTLWALCRGPCHRAHNQASLTGTRRVFRADAPALTRPGFALPLPDKNPFRADPSNFLLPARASSALRRLCSLWPSNTTFTPPHQKPSKEDPVPPAAVDQAAPKPVTHAEAGGCNSDSATFTRSRHTHSPQFIVLEIVFRYAHTRLPPIRHPEKETTHQLLSISVAPPILPLSRTDTSRPRRRHDKPN
jgi:hypothetical protein